MSKINTVRLINFNYNNNSIQVSDETFHMNGKNTLMSLRNGGGKTVFVQMMTAPFVHKRYRDTKDRIFADYFTTNKPTFILVEWQLDNDAGFVMTGMMVRRNQDLTEENRQSEEELEIIGIVSEYRQPCLQDIHHLPVVEKTDKKMTLKGWGVCKQLFESYKKDKNNQFTYFDLNSTAQTKQYFDKLQEYQIYYKEWESIIKKVNLKESGLSELFADCKDEKGLVEKWFLDIVESKLNKDKNRMKEFQNIVEKYAAQYKDNKSKIERRDIISQFREEAEAILQEVGKYQSAQQQVKIYENMIANFIKELERLLEEAGKSREEIQQELDEISKEVAYISYEKISKEIHELMDDEHNKSVNLHIIDLERESFAVERERIQKRLNLLACASARDSKVEDEKSYFEAKERLEVAKQQEEDLEPEINRLGYQLRLYYEMRCKETAKQLEQNKEEIQTHEQHLADEKLQLTTLQNNLIEEKEQIARKQAKQQNFDEQETQFNRRYQENLGRNILGEYEPGLLEAKRQLFQKQKEDGARDNLARKKQLEEEQNNRYTNQRKQEETQQAIVECKYSVEHEKQKHEMYEMELKERRNVLRYLDMTEQDIFYKDKICQISKRKLEDIDRVKRGFEKELDRLEKEYTRLTQGKVLELPEDFQEMLEHLSIQYVYGMDWLQKNGNAMEKNQELVKQYPFLPYALIVSQKELEKLQNQIRQHGDDSEAVYTSFPIPIITRESLAGEADGKDCGLVDLGQIHFYVLFNENLLDEAKLRQMIVEQKEEIDKLCGKIQQKKTEYEETFKRQEKVINQEVTQENYEQNQRAIAEAEEKQISLEGLARELKQQADAMEQRIKQLQEDIQDWEKKLERLEQKIADYAIFLEAYQEYQQLKRELSLHENELERIKNLQNIHTAQRDKEEDILKSCANARQRLVEEQNKELEKQTKFAVHEPVAFETGEAKEESVYGFEDKPEILEAKYMALTQEYSAERNMLENLYQDAKKRLDKSEDKLKRLCEKHTILIEELTNVLYDVQEEKEQEKALKRANENLDKKDMEYNKTDKDIALTKQKIELCKERMQKECHQDEPLAKENIATEDFDERIRQCQIKQGNLEKEAKLLSAEMNGYESNLTALAEYTDFTVQEAVIWQENFRSMNRKELDQFKGRMLRDYRVSQEQTRTAYDEVVSVLNRVIRMEAFQEDFYRKPLETMLQVADDAERLISQMQTTLQSYESLMEKLGVDIAMIEKEKAEIIELLYEYVHDVHENIGKIDRNSTITVRDKPVRMLKILLPEWEEHEAVYKIRLQDFVDSITLKGVSIFEQNQNAQEYFGTQITTRNLYDTVVGTGNVQIKLSKIEEQREYPITWAEVAKNSGGEGFLSAFVILSSLLYYMRRDDTDIFADKNEGKVLVMDNPFAQTNASHLLKPLMEVAKKTNTQLICLSGLGEASIYNRFDNIYVLTLKEANLRNGMQYLKGEHAQGEEAQEMILSQIEVMEQQSLLF